MKNSTQLAECTSIEQVVDIINGDTSNLGSDYIAGEYAFDAAKENGFGLTEGNFDFHLDYLKDAGANFDSAEAIAVARQFAAELNNL